MPIKRRNIIYTDDTPEYEEFRQSAFSHPSPARQKRMFELGQKARQLEIKHGLSTKKKHLKVKF